MKIAIVEDHALVADLLSTLCRRELKFDVVVLESSGAKGLQGIREHKPDLVLLDISLPDMDGLDIAEMILRELPRTRIIAISSLRDPVTLKRVRDIGVHGFVDKREQNVRMLKNAIELVSQGNEFFSPVINEVVGPLRADPKAYYRILSGYEQRVLGLIGESKSNEEIAAALNVGVSTAQSRRRDIMTKLGIHSTPKLIRYAIENGFTRSEHFPQPRKDAGGERGPPP